MPHLGDIVREVRLRHRLSQRSLAIRAGTQQSTISRIELGKESPNFERFRQLLLVMGERPVLSTEPLEHECDPAELRRIRELTPSERLARALFPQ